MEKTMSDETQNEGLGELTSFLEDYVEKAENGTLTRNDVMQWLQLATEFKKQLETIIQEFEEALFMLEE